jgi:glycosyltransferase involved in cell wall biosynthesis
MSSSRNHLTTSLIVPVFNESGYIGKLLESVRHSRQRIDEIIICDNNSTDDSVRIVKQYEDSLPVKILHQQIKGILPTVECAWRYASNDIILKVDADSVLTEDWVGNVCRHFAEDAALAGLTGPYKGADGHWIDGLLGEFGSGYGSRMYGLWKGYPLLLGANSAFRKSALEKVNGYVPGSAGPALDDQLISGKLYKAGLKTAWFADVRNYHSTRRFHNKPYEYIIGPLSLFHPKFYNQKSK